MDARASLDEVVMKQNIAAAVTQTPFVLPISSLITRYLFYSARFHTNLVACNCVCIVHDECCR